MSKPTARPIAYFVSPHGYGHAARACAVMAALQSRDPSIRFDIFTRVPGWFFDDSLAGPFTYHSLSTDVGVIQDSPFHEDLRATVKRLREMLPFDPGRVGRIARLLRQLGCRAVLCDISPLGIQVALQADIPSVLIENFTWDWIYEGYARAPTQLAAFVPYLKLAFAAADYRIQTEPVCEYRRADLVTAPVSRPVRTPRRLVRKQLGIAADEQMVLVTLGGVEAYAKTGLPDGGSRVRFVVPGDNVSARWRGGAIFLPRRSSYFHPDLVNASDAVVGKLGYSTVSEAFHAGVALGYVPRPGFREYGVLRTFVRNKLPCVEITEGRFQEGRWGAELGKLLCLQRLRRRGANGAAQAAAFVDALLGSAARAKPGADQLRST